MVAIVMTEDGPEVDPRDDVLPLLTRRAEVDALVAGILGRNLTESQRAMAGAVIAARIPRRAGGDRRSPDRHDRATSTARDDGTPDLPTQAQIARSLGVSVSSASRARTVLGEGPPALRELVEQGHVPVFTAFRVTRELPRERQDEFIRRVHGGAEPVTLVAALQGESRAHRAGPVARDDNRSPGRHRYVTTAALRSLSDSLDALRLVLGSTDGLDPALTPEEAARWLDGLLKGRRSLASVVKLLTERKESNQ